MVWFVLVVVALLLVAVALEFVVPTSLRPSQRLWLARLAAPLRHRLRPRPAEQDDPFAILWLQERLGVLADEIRRLEHDQQVYRRVHRLTVTRAAYDDLLDEACRLAGVTVPRESPRSDAGRWREERELAERGWSW